MMKRGTEWLKNECIKWKRDDVNTNSFEEYLYGDFDFMNNYCNQLTGWCMELGLNYIHNQIIII